MNFIEMESAQKLRGGFYTQPEIAEFMVRWVLEKNPQNVLEPSCGGLSHSAARSNDA